MNKAECLEQAEQFVRMQLASMDKYVEALRESGNLVQAERAEREVARVRRRAERQLETLPGRLGEAEVRIRKRLDDLVTALERNLARGNAAD